MADSTPDPDRARAARKIADIAPGELKRTFGEKLTFCGGLSTQDLLVRATADEVGREVQEVGDVQAAAVPVVVRGVEIEARRRRRGVDIGERQREGVGPLR